MMTRDQLLGEIARAVRAAWPDRADELLLELERRLPPDGFEKIHRRVGLDPLTALWNKAAIMELVRTELRERTTLRGPRPAESATQPLCMLLGDLDHLKRMNDVHGHSAADFVLQETATRLKSALPEGEVIGRYGGEEFASVFARDLEATRAIAERMRASVADQAMTWEGTDLHVTISFGIAEWKQGMDESALWRAADDAVQEAKVGGRNRVAG